MSLYDEFRELAEEMLAEFGAPAKLFRVHAEYDPLTDTRSKYETVESCFAVVTPRKIRANNGVIEIQLMARLNVEPEIGDKLSQNGKAYTIEDVEEIDPINDGPILYMAVLK